MRRESQSVNHQTKPQTPLTTLRSSGIVRPMNTLPRRYAGVPGFNVGDDTPVPPSLVNNLELIQDLARYSEGLFTREQVKRRWKKLITEEMWDTLGSNDELVDRIEAEKVRRVRDGSAKREKAQQHVVAAPDILNGIMSDPKQSAKHRIDSAKALDSLTGNPAEAAQQERIVIRIDLGADIRASGGTPTQADVLTFEVTPNPNNIHRQHRTRDPLSTRTDPTTQTRTRQTSRIQEQTQSNG